MTSKIPMVWLTSKLTSSLEVQKLSVNSENLQHYSCRICATITLFLKYVIFLSSDRKKNVSCGTVWITTFPVITMNMQIHFFSVCHSGEGDFSFFKCKIYLLAVKTFYLIPEQLMLQCWAWGVFFKYIFKRLGKILN